MGAKVTKTNSFIKKSPSKILRENDIQMLLDNTSFTREQIQQWHTGFMSDCSDGQLTQKKFIEIYKLFYPSGKAEKFCQHVFRTFDQDKNNFIDFNEFLIAISVTSRGDLKKKLEWAFTMYDIDGNGKVDRREMKKIIKKFDWLKNTCLLSFEFIQYMCRCFHEPDFKCTEPSFTSTCQTKVQKYPVCQKFDTAIYELLGDSEAATSDTNIDKQVSEIFRKLDTNHDNSISREEFINGCTQDESLRKLLAPST